MRLNTKHCEEKSGLWQIIEEPKEPNYGSKKMIFKRQNANDQ